MADLLKELEAYCTQLGAAPSVSLDEESQGRLPLYLKQLYQPVKATLFGQTIHLMVNRRDENPTPSELEAHARVISRHLGPDVAFLFGGLASFDRNRLLKKRIPFIVPNRQMFLPGGMIDLRETHGPASKMTAVLSMPSQLLLLYHLQKRPEQVLTLSEWAAVLGYSKMTISRAHRELASAGLIATGPGKTVSLRFVIERQALWEKALPLLRSPVQHEGFYRLPSAVPPYLLAAGLSALSQYTDLAAGPQRVMATWRLSLQNQPTVVPLSYRDEDAVIIQRWWYTPGLLTREAGVVDRLSLFLSMRDDADERVQIALNKLMKGMTW